VVNWSQGKTDRRLSNAGAVLPEMESTKQLVRLVSEVYKPGMRVLDVGCNTGHYLRGLRRISEKLDYTGVDAYPFYIDQAKEVYATDQYAHFEVKDIHESLFPETPFDIVYCCNVILHLPDFRGPVTNLLNSTRSVCFIRTLLGDYTSVVQRAMNQVYDDRGQPLDFVYQNTWEQGYFTEFIRGLGWNVELIDDEFDPAILQREYESLKKGQGTRVANDKQVDGNIVFNWVWAKITRP
jgi:SAM-dependent methyltransferase